MKDGPQRAFFTRFLEEHYPALVTEYAAIYHGQKYGEASPEYYAMLNDIFNLVMNRYEIPRRIPPALYSDMIDENDKIVVILEHIDYILKSAGHTSPYGYAAYGVSQVKEPIREMRGTLRTIKGVGKRTEALIKEVLDTGTCRYYEAILARGVEPCQSRGGNASYIF